MSKGDGVVIWDMTNNLGKTLKTCARSGFYYVSYNDVTEKLCLRCNNGWVQSNRPDYAAMIIRSTKFN
jgi:hypothetical protein